MAAQCGENHHQWRGGIRNTIRGYVVQYAPDHPRACDGCVYQHTLVAEKVLGKHLPPKAVIHHVDGDPSNNEHKNLVVCQNSAYHNLLHQRQRAYEATGDANMQFCWRCKEYFCPRTSVGGRRQPMCSPCAIVLSREQLRDPVFRAKNNAYKRADYAVKHGRASWWPERQPSI